MSPSRGYNSSAAVWHPVSLRASFLSSSTREFHGQRAGQCRDSLLVCSETLVRRRRRRRRAWSYPEAADAAVAVGKLSRRHLAVQGSDVRCL